MTIRTSSTLLLLCLLERVDGHLYMMTPVSRNLWGTTAFNDPSYEYINYCPHCYQSRGQAMVRDRAERLTDPAELASYGNGAWPHLVAYERGEIAANGNYLESDAISVRHGICGDPEQTSPEDSNRYGRANTNYPVLETYIEGTVLEIKIVVSTSHVAQESNLQKVVPYYVENGGETYPTEITRTVTKEGSTFRRQSAQQTTEKGHLEFFLCDTADMDDADGVVNQECFNMHPLDRAEGDGDASPIDPDHAGRYYLDPPCRSAETDQTLLPGVFPGDVTTARYQLPSGVTCTRCILQMVYYTGNSCMHVGYDEFNPPSWPSECAPNKQDWIATGMGLCGDGNNYPEEYWNCADIEIIAAGDPTSPAPVPAPVPESSSEPETPAPYSEETPAPAIEETPPPTNGNTPAPINVETPAPTNEETPTPANGATLAPINEETPSPTNDETPAPTNEATPSPVTILTLFPVIDETPAPAFEIPQPETPAPVEKLGPSTPTPFIEQTTTPETAAPTLSDGEPFNEPILITLPPATFAPSIAATEMPPDECDDPIAAYGQCGGDSYEGSTCCRPGFECTAIAACYSECRRISKNACSEGWGQCGGRNWEGPTCCWKGAICLERNEWFSQCVPETRI